MKTRQRAMPSWTKVLLLVLTPLAAAGCGELTAGGLADVETVVSGDAPDEEGSAVASASHVTPVAPVASGDDGVLASSQTQGSRPVGDVFVTLEISIQSPDGEWIPLTDGLEEATVNISGTTEARLHEEQLEPGVYPAVRVRFTEVRAQIESGLPVSEEVRVDFGEEGSLTVEDPLELNVEAGDALEILVDMNTTQWLNAAGPALPVVAARHLRNAVEIRIHGG